MAYRYIAVLCFLLSFSECKQSTEPLSGPITPPAIDSTSHEFTWRVDTIRNGWIYDMAVIDRNNIWLVGEFYIADSTGQTDYQATALAKWNGVTWSYEKVAYHDWGNTAIWPGPLFAIRAFALNDIYVCSWANLLHWNGSSWTESAFFMTAIPFEGQIKSMAGQSLPNLYCAGNTGSIFKFASGSWKRLPTRTTATIVDIHGSITPSGYQLLAVGSGPTLADGNPVLFVHDESVSTVTPINSTDWHNSVWVSPSGRGYLAGSRIWSRMLNPDSSWTLETAKGQGFQKIRGVADNDIVVIGPSTQVQHYNGATWLTLGGLQAQVNYLIDMDYADQLVAIIGQTADRQVVIFGSHL